MLYLYILPSLVSGGAEHQTINHVNYLYQHVTPDTHLLVIHRGGKLGGLLQLPDDHIHRLNLQPRKFNHLYVCNLQVLLASRAVTRLLRVESIDCVISVLESASYLARISLLHYGNRKQIKLITYYRSISFQISPLTSLPRKAFNAFIGYLARLDSGSIFISEAVKQDITAHRYVSPHQRVIYNSLPFSKPVPHLAAGYLNEGDEKRYGFSMLLPGRLHLAKGHLPFLEALAGLIKQKELSPSSLHLFLAGDGPLLQDIKTHLHQLQITEFVTILGTVPNDLMLSFMAGVDLVVIPSIYEGFGNVAIEALMSGATTLTSNSGGLDEIIHYGVNGYKFSVNDFSACQRLLTDLYDNYAARKIDPQVSLADFQARFTLAGQMAQIIDFVASVP